ncbi:hypothetical protein BKA61DRAFT_574351 [Leptodontidium sp. MPI-SDFR-AT-0119]|nr:hypothetical protein BKA61DRAFT_574351 [Leptodontidium sp. MPI-SDFR-AT-0119]
MNLFRNAGDLGNASVENTMVCTIQKLATGSAMDRLPAFFGFASFYAQSVGGSIQTDYFAGLWRKSLHEDMLWRIDSSAHKLETQGNRLCCCFDSTYSSDSNWRSNLLQDGKEPYLGPSWSWVSARTLVQYLKGFQRGSQGKGCEFGPVEVNYTERHLIGPIASAALTVNSGHVTRALLQYEYLPGPVDRRIKHHNIFSYGLEITKNARHLDFELDYVLSLEGERWISPATRVFVLHIASGAHLVLKEESFFELKREADVQVGFHLQKGPNLSSWTFAKSMCALEFSAFLGTQPSVTREHIGSIQIV